MLRCLQGLLFLGVGLFALKWEFHGSRDMGIITPAGEVFYTAKSFFQASPPWHVAEKVAEAAVLAAIGLYVWLTGEVVRLSGRTQPYSPVTFLAAVSAFLAVFAAKFAWHRGDPSGYYPPFDSVSLAAVYGFFGLVAAYYLVIGEVQYWRGAKTPNKALPRTGHATDVSARFTVFLRLSRPLSLVFVLSSRSATASR